MMAYKYLTIIILLLALLVGCAGGDEIDQDFNIAITKINPYFFGYTNYKILEFGNIHIESFANTVTIIFIGNPSSPYQQEQNIFITFPDNGEAINMSSVNVLPGIKKHLVNPDYVDSSQVSQVRWPSHNNVTHKTDYWPEGTVRYWISENLQIYIKDALVIGLDMRSIQSSSDDKYPLKIGVLSGELFELPLSPFEIKTLFGQPNNIYETFQM